MKVAAAQTFVSADVAANGQAIRAMIAHAAAAGARLINFCEGALSGYAKSQIVRPDLWAAFDWDGQQKELLKIANLCGQLGLFAAVGAAHRLSETHPPHNSVYVFADDGKLLTRYDKRYLSNSELQGWYTPGGEPVVFQVDGYRFGCAICIESQFPEVFLEYERLGVDGVLFSSYGIPENFQIALRAHAGLNCLWISAATSAQTASKGPAGIIGPDGKCAALCQRSAETDLVIATVERSDPAYDIPLQKARPWRAKARQGEIYREKMTDQPRSANRSII